MECYSLSNDKFSEFNLDGNRSPICDNLVVYECVRPGLYRVCLPSKCDLSGVLGFFSENTVDDIYLYVSSPKRSKYYSFNAVVRCSSYDDGKCELIDEFSGEGSVKVDLRGSPFRYPNGDVVSYEDYLVRPRLSEWDKVEEFVNPYKLLSLGYNVYFKNFGRSFNKSVLADENISDDLGELLYLWKRDILLFGFGASDEDIFNYLLRDPSKIHICTHDPDFNFLKEEAFFNEGIKVSTLVVPPNQSLDPVKFKY